MSVETNEEVELCKDFNLIKARKEALAKQVKDVNAELEQAQKKIIEHLVDSGKTSTGFIEGVGNISLVKTVYPSITAGDLPQFIETIRDTDDFGMVKEIIPPPTLKAYLKEKITEYTERYIENEDFIEEDLKGLELLGIEYKLEEDDDELVSPAKAASRYWKFRGCKIFEETKLSHRDRVKPSLEG